MSYNENIIRSMTFAVASHSQESSLCVNIKDPNAKKEKKEENSNIDLILSQIQFEA